MDLSAVIFVVLALAWAMYLIPTALRHHDEIARTRSIDRFSNAMRVLARREPVNRRDTRLVVTPPRRQPRVLLPQPSATGTVSAGAPESAGSTSAPEQAPASTSGERRAAARAAAKRRRRILALLLVAVLAVVGLAALGYLPWWAAAIPGGLMVVFLVLCRVLVRRERRAWSPGVKENRPAARRPAARVQAPYGTPQRVVPVAGTSDRTGEPVPAAQHERAGAAERTAAAQETAPGGPAAASEPAPRGGSLWDPLPLTLPTYVGKPRAARTVRTIDLSEPGSWSSGRSEADSRLVEEAAAARETVADGSQEQRAVGS